MAETYLVKVREVHEQDVYIKAISEEEAKELVREGNGSNGDMHYVSTLDATTWKVTKK